MAETDFFMIDREWVDLASFLIEEFSAGFVPAKSVAPPPFPRYTEMCQILDHMERDRDCCRFFVLSPLWELYPLQVREIHANDGSHFYMVDMRCGGPAFDFILPRTRTQGGLRWMVSGSFSDYPSYYVPNSTQYATFARPESMAAAYKEVQKVLRSKGCRSVCVEDGRPGPWVLDGAAAEFVSGTWLRAGDWHFAPKPRKRTPSTPCS